jgi:tRNA(fMet)-specific endonuclease VapC
MKYLLDTNVWITILRDPTSYLSARFNALTPADICACSIVVAELRHGCLRSAKPAANRNSLDALLAPYVSLPFDDAAADQYAAVRHHLESIGQLIGPLDLQIAAIALAHGCTLVTHNTAEFSRVPGLVIDDWQAP